MNDHEIPAEAPPPYSETPAASSTLKPVPRNGIPPDVRRSMEDERRDLPRGWVRQLDPVHHHHFYVDTTQDPPRSIWHHPYDDDQYLSTLKAEERERIQTLHRVPTKADLEAETTDEDEPGPSNRPNNRITAASPSQAPEIYSAQKLTFGRKLKDKLTGSTHEERETSRRQRAEDEIRYYEQHQKVRLAMARAMQTGQPQLIGKDAQGHDLYMEPPSMGPGRGQMHGFPGAGVPSRYSPYGNGIYQDPNARFIRPPTQYQRPMYGGYGGGLGLPLAAGLGGGLLFGGLLGAGL